MSTHKAQWRVPRDKKIGDEVSVPFGKGQESRLYKSSAFSFRGIILNPFQSEEEKENKKKTREEKEIIHHFRKGKVAKIRGNKVKIHVYRSDGSYFIIYRKRETGPPSLKT